MSLLTQPADVAPITREAVAQRLKGGKVDIASEVYKWAMLACLLVSLAILVLLIWSVLGEGLEVLLDRGTGFLTSGNSGDSTTAGMWQAIYGSFFIALFVAATLSVVTAPLTVVSLPGEALAFVRADDFSWSRIPDIGWFPRRGSSDIRTPLGGSLLVTVLAMLVARPFGVRQAI